MPARQSKSTDMLKNYFKTALRNVKRNKGFFVLNFTGLYISVVVCILISLIILHETSFDKHDGNICFTTTSRAEDEYVCTHVLAIKPKLIIVWFSITKESNAVLMKDRLGEVHIITKHDIIESISK